MSDAAANQAANAAVVHAANQAALARLYAIKPYWSAVSTARAALELPEFTLLHAGPPYADPCAPPAPVQSSAVICCLYEKWATTEAEAEHLIASGKVKLVPAQSYGAVTPLAAVISPSTMLVEVADANQPTQRAWSLLGSGAGPQIRFGGRDPALLERLHWRDTTLAAALVQALRNDPLELLPFAATGVANGDDLHSRTTAATAALRARLAPHLASTEADMMLSQTPLFFLTLWMAACHLMMSAAASAQDADSAATLVVALAGNGREVGIRLARQPARWFSMPATAPQGPRLNAASSAAAAPLTGDSGVIDIAGFGAQAFALAAEPATVFTEWLPPDWRRDQPKLLAGVHPAFNGLRCALDATQVVAENLEPLAAIAMIGADGRAGLLGRGVCTIPRELFKTALNVTF